MVKATRRSAVLLGVAAIGLLAASGPSFAEVQNVKVGGDVTIRSFWRKNLDLNQEGCNTGAAACTVGDASGAGATPLEGDAFFMTTTGINIGADLTENVSAFIRLANERDWAQDGGATGDIDISQAYVTLKELFYSPLTVRIGTQPIVWGRGFILGSNLLPSVLSGIGAGNDRNTAITANEFTDFTAFDALRATLDLSSVANVPVTLDAVYIKLDENTPGIGDDSNIMGFNLGTKLDAMNSEFEAYFLNKRDKNGNALAAGPALAPGSGENGSVNTLGIRGSAKPVEGASVYGELAYQFGKRTPGYDAEIHPTGDATHGWAVDLGTDYTLDVATKPKLGGEWIYYSGTDNAGAQTGWDPIAPSYFPTLLRSFQTRSTAAGLYPVDQPGVPSAYTNQHELALYGSFKPIEDLTIAPRLSWFIADVPIKQPPIATLAQTGRNRFLGTEWDTRVTYDYTDDVQFGLAYGLFLPGNVFRNTINVGAVSGNDSHAQELITSVSVKF